MGLVHLVAARVRPTATAEDIAKGVRLGRLLADAPDVRACWCGQSDGQLVAAVWLDGPEALEPFAASAPHMSFIMRGLAPVISGMWSASVAADGAPPAAHPSETPAALWLFAIPEVVGVFEWEVRELLLELEGLPGDTWVGPTVEERERYRAGGAVLLGEAARVPFRAALKRLRERSSSLGDRLEDAWVDGPLGGLGRQGPETP